MSTYTYNGYTLNGYLNSPNYDTEQTLFKDILDRLPPRGTTAVTTEHNHSRLAFSSGDVSAMAVGTSGVINLPYLAQGVAVIDGSANLTSTASILSYVNTPGNQRVVVGGSTGIGGSANLTFDGTTLVTTALRIGADCDVTRTDVGEITMGISATGMINLVVGTDVFTKEYGAFVPSIQGITGIGSTGLSCNYQTVGKSVDAWYHVSGETGFGDIVRLSLPVQAAATMENMKFPVCTHEDTIRAIGSARIDSGLTGIIVYADGTMGAGTTGWIGNPYTREVIGHIRYVSA